jgi:hypothetical protein
MSTGRGVAGVAGVTVVGAGESVAIGPAGAEAPGSAPVVAPALVVEMSGAGVLVVMVRSWSCVAMR